MGAIAFMTTGTVLYNPLSGSDGSLASYYEWSTLDPCYGHSSADKQYHYHAVSLKFSCILGLLGALIIRFSKFCVLHYQ